MPGLLLQAAGVTSAACITTCSTHSVALNTQSNLPTDNRNHLWLQGIASLSVQWGAWSGSGMASAETAARVERMGMAMVAPDSGLAALQGLLASRAAAPVVGATPFNWPRFLQRLQPRQRTQLFDAFAPAEAAGGSQLAGVESSRAAAAPRAASGRISKDAVTERVASAAAAVLGGPVAPTASLMEAGLDSLGAVELRNSLSKQFGLELPATLTFDYPTTQAIAGFILESLAPLAAQENEAAAGPSAAFVETEAEALAVRPPSGVSGARPDALAITGLSLRFAGGIDSTATLHSALAQAPELQTVGPYPRWDTGDGCGVMTPGQTPQLCPILVLAKQAVLFKG